MNHQALFKKLNINYLIYSHISAKVVRRCLKKEFLPSALEREKSVIQIFSFKGGERGDEVGPLKINPIDENIDEEKVGVQQGP
ncbi:hypothetical protein JTB14_029346 [Gonioctena quinquepunctata]|nr:hypothetical protein JTB14_029346 [Gonioctena quinquepunctata]